MHTFLRLMLFSLAVSLQGTPTSVAEVRDTKEVEAVKARSWELVESLGDPSFRVRQEASRELLRMGRIARDALNAGKADPNPEVRHRCRQLLPIAERLDLMARIDAFLSNPEGDHELPGLSQYLAIVGDEKSARGLYAEMLKHDADLLTLAETGNQQVVTTYRNRVIQTQQLFNTGVRVVNGTRIEPEIPHGQLASLLFIGMADGFPDNDTSHRTLSSLFYRSTVQQVFQGKGESEALRKLFYGWLEKRASDYASYQGVYLILRAEMKDAVPALLKLTTNQETYMRTRGLAVLALGQLGNASHIPAIEGLFDDQGVLSNVVINNVRGTVQVRDVALAMSIHLAGQKVTDYPFDMMRGRPLTFTSFTNLGFSDDAKREEAFKKWKASKLMK